MQMRKRFLLSLLLLAISLMLVPAAAAQSPSAEWEAWNAQITAHDNGAPLDIAETQIIDVTGGQLRGGTRDYSQPVTIQSVFVAVNGGQPQQLQQGSGTGSYTVSRSSDGVLLDYTLPSAVSAGQNFVVQINYTVPSVAAGLIDWYVVPADHPGVVNSSRVTINFPEGQAPDPSFVRMTESAGTVSVSGSSIVVQSNGALQDGQAFAVQAPFGESVGVPANPSNSNPVNPAVVPTAVAPRSTPAADTGFNLGGILPILCIIGVVLLIGGSRLLPGLFGSLLGGAINRGTGGGSIFPGGSSGGGFFGGGSNNNPPTSGGTFGGGSSGGSSGRGFRASSNQNRSVPTVRNDKRRGGGASFK